MRTLRTLAASALVLLLGVTASACGTTTAEDNPTGTASATSTNAGPSSPDSQAGLDASQFVGTWVLEANEDPENPATAAEIEEAGVIWTLDLYPDGTFEFTIEQIDGDTEWGNGTWEVKSSTTALVLDDDGSGAAVAEMRLVDGKLRLDNLVFVRP